MKLLFVFGLLLFFAVRWAWAEDTMSPDEIHIFTRRAQAPYRYVAYACLQVVAGMMMVASLVWWALS